jgi:hypothetical protein
VRRGDGTGRASVRALLLAATLSGALLGGLACGGGSPSDIVLPQEVDVSLAPLDAPGPHSIGLELAAASGRDVSVRVTGRALEEATGVAFELQYDTDLLELVGPDPGTFFGPSGVTGAADVDGVQGRLVGVAAKADQATGSSGDGTLLTLRFRLRQLRDADSDLIFGVPQSLVYGPAGVAGQHSFTGARLSTRIRAPR